MQALFAFTFDPEKKEGTFTGNIEPQIALQILHMLIAAVEDVKAEQQTQSKSGATVVKAVSGDMKLGGEP